MEDIKLKTITLKQAIKMLDKQYSLTYVDYRDHIEDVNVLAEIVAKGYSEILSDAEWIFDQQFESVEEIIKTLFSEYDITEIEDDLRPEIYDRDDSTPMEDLMKNTGDVVMYYDLDYEVNGYPEDIIKEAKGVAKILKIPYFQYEKALKELVANASYGGKLVLLYKTSIEDYAGDLTKKYMVIQNPEVCIMDRWNGSGHSLDGLGDYKVRLDRTRLKLDEAAPGYSFAGDVCGMVVERKVTIFTNDRKGVIGPKAPRELSLAEKREMAFEKKWKETKECSAGDMNTLRHKDKPYENNYPCGNRCTKCGTFWVD